MPKYGNTVFYDFKSRFFFIFSSNYRHALVLKIPFPSHIFPKISKYRTKNLHFPFTSIYYAAYFPNHPYIYKDKHLFVMLKQSYCQSTAKVTKFLCIKKIVPSTFHLTCVNHFCYNTSIFILLNNI